MVFNPILMDLLVNRFGIWNVTQECIEDDICTHEIESYLKSIITT